MRDTALREIIRQEKKEYFKAWRAANKDKVAGYNRNYWQKRAQAKLDKQKEAAADGKGN